MDLCTKRGANHKELLSKSCTVGTRSRTLVSPKPTTSTTLRLRSGLSRSVVPVVGFGETKVRDPVPTVMACGLSSGWLFPRLEQRSGTLIVTLPFDPGVGFLGVPNSRTTWTESSPAPCLRLTLR